MQAGRCSEGHLLRRFAFKQVGVSGELAGLSVSKQVGVLDMCIGPLSFRSDEYFGCVFEPHWFSTH